MILRQVIGFGGGLLNAGDILNSMAVIYLVLGKLVSVILPNDEALVGLVSVQILKARHGTVRIYFRLAHLVLLKGISYPKFRKETLSELAEFVGSLEGCSEE